MSMMVGAPELNERRLRLHRTTVDLWWHYTNLADWLLHISTLTTFNSLSTYSTRLPFRVRRCT